MPGALAVLLLAPLLPAASWGSAAAVAPQASQAGTRAEAADHDHAGTPHDHAGTPHDHAEGCHGEVVEVAGAPTACAHADEPPPGVDVTAPVTTEEAIAREGALESAAEAAAELGAPSPVEAAATPSVPCDGDGTSGYRTQAMYVVEADKPNRYTQLLPSLTAWAAGANEVVNRSAALTGGVRDVRFVHEPGTSDCRPVVLNVTVPAGTLASFGASISAVQAQGYTSPTRKYLMWTDATVLCGIALQYLDDRPGQDNANNGRYPQYARTDAGCWGGSYSVEAHELVHTLGAVQASAPHKSAAGHCTDDYDRMCYRDGSVVMTYPCPIENESLLDCNGDDYFSTYPPAGSYLDSRWNSADSRFLVGGGDGVDGGQAGLPQRLGVSVRVNSPGVPGLPTQATATLELPAGRTAGVVWKASRTDCVLGSPTALQTSVTCPATTTSTTVLTLTATATDSTGQKAVAAAPLTFSSVPRRTVTVAVDAAGTSGTYSGCAGAPTPVRATVVDVQSGVPVLGATVALQRRTATTAATTVSTGRTTASGTHTVSPALVDGQLWSARTTLTGPFDVAASTADLQLRAEPCTTAVTLQAAGTTAWAGDTVAFSGTALRRTASGVESPVAGVAVTLLQTKAGTTAPVSIGTARTDATGAWTASPVVLASGPVQARLAAAPGSSLATSAAVPLTVTPTVTRLAASSTLSTYYAAPVVVSGTLRRDEGGDLGPVAAGRVQVSLLRPGTTTATVLGTATTDATGAWSLTVKPTVGGALSAVYAGVTGQPAARTAIGDLSVASWTTTTTMTATPAATTQGGTVSVTGSVTRTGGSLTQPAPSLAVKVYLQPAVGGAEVLVGSGTTRADGTYTVAARPTQNGALRARVESVVGYVDSASSTSPVTVAARVALTVSTRTPRATVPFTVRATVVPAQVATVRLESSVGGGAWTTVESATTASTGMATFTVTRPTTGAVAYRATVVASTMSAGATSPATTVTVGP